MTKSDLRIGYVVEIATGKKYMVLPTSENTLTLARKGRFIDISDIADDLTCLNENFDIVKVYGYSEDPRELLFLDIAHRPLLWERKEETQEQPANSIESLNDFAKEVHQNAVDHGFWEKEPSFGEIIALCHSELSEALEAYRQKMPLVYFIDETADTDGSIEKDMSSYNGQKLEGIATEMIDCILRILDWCGANSIDVENLLCLKHEYNKTRPYKHGGKAL